MKEWKQTANLALICASKESPPFFVVSQGRRLNATNATRQSLIYNMEVVELVNKLCRNHCDRSPFLRKS